MGKFRGDYRGRVGKIVVLEYKSDDISEMRKDSTEGLIKLCNALSNGTVHPRSTAYGLLFLKSKIGGSQPHPNSNRYYLRNG